VSLIACRFVSFTLPYVVIVMFSNNAVDNFMNVVPVCSSFLAFKLSLCL